MLLELLGGEVLHAAKVERCEIRHRDGVPSALSLLRVNACVRSLLFQWRRARVADVRQKDLSHPGRWKGVSGSVPEAL